MNDMTNVEAYNILGDMWYEATSKEKEAINLAQDAVQFVDLMPKDMARVVFCADCVKHGNDEKCPLLSVMAYTEPSDHCSYGERKDGDGK